MYNERIRYLTNKFFAGTYSESEKEELAIWIKENPDQTLIEALENEWDDFESDIRMPDHVSNRILSNILASNSEISSSERFISDSSTRYLWSKIAAAAVLILSLGIYWWSGKDRSPVALQTTARVVAGDIAPGGNKAILTLGDGSSIMLDSAKNGNLASQGNTNITKSKKGELVYNVSGVPDQAVVFNTMATPKGGQYHIVLPDGSKVWLNAASSLRFPTAFKGKERKVEITGEVYFEVAHNARMPFIVKSGDTEIAVLGTHFNVMAYADEKVMKTTLLEGSVKVSIAGGSATLLPGQQARIKSITNNIRVVDNIDTEKEMAWKNGFFQFQDDNLENIMRQISRWYDVDVTYEGNPGKETYTGRLPRNANVSKVFKILSLSGVKFRIEGKSIIVTP
ncbi:FecR domain-containing protein [Dyadobacter chenwenxiniae]|uniref:FecR domain-containing protein n=1 Tax=Dyadobacter chenwenxiniae TaxID=2906456 RepID=A0A9X1PRT4_9BACT|nr:FecR family protein [Dyadobacter chenwenxiniae]MCF0065746.1 FecR domain-containing protein [Dyadobacter chenwenxiniae]UON84118.1 FecR domain-containing protein [Dyadobacter chenwenxiniae]